MKPCSVKSSTLSHLNRMLSLGVVSAVALSLVVACGGADGGKEVFKQGITPPATAKPSSKRFFDRDDDENLASRLLGASAAATADGADAKVLSVSVGVVVVDPTDSAKARAIVGSGGVNAGGASAPAKAAAVQNQNENADNSGSTASAATQPTQPVAKPAGEKLTIDPQQSSQNGTEKVYALSAICEDAPCNTLHVLLTERGGGAATADDTAKSAAPQDADSKAMRTIRLVFVRNKADEAFRIASCPAAPGGASASGSVSPNQQKALRARGFVVAKSVASDNTSAAANACAQIPDFNAASGNPGSGRKLIPLGSQPAPTPTPSEQPTKPGETPQDPQGASQENEAGAAPAVDGKIQVANLPDESATGGTSVRATTEALVPEGGPAPTK